MARSKTVGVTVAITHDDMAALLSIEKRYPQFSRAAIGGALLRDAIPNAGRILGTAIQETVDDAIANKERGEGQEPT